MAKDPGFCSIPQPSRSEVSRMDTGFSLPLWGSAHTQGTPAYLWSSFDYCLWTSNIRHRDIFAETVTQPPQFPEHIPLQIVTGPPLKRIHDFLAEGKFPSDYIQEGLLLRWWESCLVLMATVVIPSLQYWNIKFFSDKISYKVMKAKPEMRVWWLLLPRNLILHRQWRNVSINCLELDSSVKVVSSMGVDN